MEIRRWVSKHHNFWFLKYRLRFTIIYLGETSFFYDLCGRKIQRVFISLYEKKKNILRWTTTIAFVRDAQTNCVTGKPGHHLVLLTKGPPYTIHHVQRSIWVVERIGLTFSSSFLFFPSSSFHFVCVVPVQQVFSSPYSMSSMFAYIESVICLLYPFRARVKRYRKLLSDLTGAQPAHMMHPPGGTLNGGGPLRARSLGWTVALQLSLYWANMSSYQGINRAKAKKGVNNIANPAGNPSSYSFADEEETVDVFKLAGKMLLDAIPREMISWLTTQLKLQRAKEGDQDVQHSADDPDGLPAQDGPKGSGRRYRPEAARVPETLADPPLWRRVRLRRGSESGSERGAGKVAQQPQDQVVVPIRSRIPSSGWRVSLFDPLRLFVADGFSILAWIGAFKQRHQEHGIGNATVARHSIFYRHGNTRLYTFNEQFVLFFHKEWNYIDFTLFTTHMF